MIYKKKNQCKKCGLFVHNSRICKFKPCDKNGTITFTSENNNFRSVMIMIINL